MTVRVTDIHRCLHGIIPSAIATADRQGIPNVTYVSHVELVDESHVALSCQFFNKTRENVSVNPHASLQVNDPIDFSTYRLNLLYRHSETEGPLYEKMRARIEAIAAHTGMTGVFRLLSADVYFVEKVIPVVGFLDPLEGDAVHPSPEGQGPMTELRGLQTISHCINQASDLDSLVREALGALDDALGFEHSMLFELRPGGQLLAALGSHGYGNSGRGAEVLVGEGLIGKAAEECRVIRTVGMEADLRYARAVRERAAALGHRSSQTEVPLPGIPDAQSQMALPLRVGERLVGVLAVESSHPLRFEQWHETFLELIGNQLALALDRFARQTQTEDDSPTTAKRAESEEGAPRHLIITYYQGDDCLFLGDEYLVRGLPGRILWKLLRETTPETRKEFSNRQLRLDATLGLPALKDNLESRLLLLRRRLEEKCPEIALVPVRRGRFELKLEVPVDLQERP